MYEEDVLDRPAGLYWLNLWRELKNAQVEKQRRDYGT